MKIYITTHTLFRFRRYYYYQHISYETLPNDEGENDVGYSIQV